MDATLNVRMSASLKERGDKVLRENGVSTSTAVRALWREMASTRELPDFLKKATSEDAAREAKTQTLSQLVGVAEGPLSELPGEKLDAAEMTRYE